MKQTKRLLCLALSLIMLLSLFPASALADEPVNLSASEEAQDDDSEASNDDEPVGDGVLDVPNDDNPVILSASEESQDDVLDVPNDDAALDDEDEILRSAQDDEDTPAPVRVVFVCEPAETVVTVYDPAQPDENGEPTVIDPEEDGSWLLVPGTYLYDADCKGYISAVKVELIVSYDKGNTRQEVEVVLNTSVKGSLQSTTKGTSHGTKGIYNNGLNGITIDIYSAPYTTYANKSYGQYAWGPQGCAWFASARLSEITGKDTPIWNGSSWYNSQYSNYGFTRGSEPVAKALACYENHVSVVEIVSGNVITISEGGNSAYSSNDYCVIHNLTRTNLESSRGGAFLGYVYLTGEEPTTPTAITFNTVCAKSGNANGSAVTSVAVDKAILFAAMTFGNDNKPDYFNLYLGTKQNQLNKLQISNNTFSDSMLATYYPNCTSWIDFNDPSDIASNPLVAGTTYYYQFEIVTRSSLSYRSEVKTFSTTGTAPTYTISYNANGGTGAPANQTKTHGVALTLSSTKPTRANASAGSYTVTLNANRGSVGTSSLTAARTTSYSFKNWNTAQNGSGTSYNSGASYTANAAATLYAQWNSSTATASVTLPTPTRSGHSFQGWATSSGATSGVTGSYTPTGNVTLYATWKADIYTVSYNANGGTGAPANQTKTHDVALTLSSTKPTRANASAGSYTVTLNANGGSVGTSSLTAARTTSYSFKNWNTAQNGSGTSYNSGASYTANTDATLYAQWNSSTATASVTLPTPTRSGYSFQGWATSSGATSGVTGSYTPSADVTLYAAWQPNDLVVQYHSNGGTIGENNYNFSLDDNGNILLDGSTTISTLHYGTTYANGLMNAHTFALSREGYQFVGWCLSADGSTTVFDQDEPLNAETIVPGLANGNATAKLYAIWEANTYTISYNANGGADAPDAQTKTHGVALTLSSTKPTRANASAGNYTITLNANGGSVGTSSLTAARTTSYSFKNWNTAQNGSGTSYNSGASYTANTDATLYAQWNSNTTTAAVTLPTPTREGYSFLGWAESADAQSGMTGSYTPSADITLYAIWKENAPPISPDAPSFHVAEVNGRAGGTVTVPVTIKNNPGIALFKVNVEYDENILEWTGISHKALDGFWSAEVGKPVVWVGNGDAEYEDDGEIFTLTFAVKENIEPQTTSIHLSYDPDDIQSWNEELIDYENVAFAVIEGKVNIVSTVSLTGTALSWNNNADVEVLLYTADTEDSVLNAAAQSGDYSGALKTGVLGEITASGKQYACTFTVSDIEPGTYKLLVMKPGKYVPVIRTVELNEDTTLDPITLWLYGDVTADGKVNGTDALQIKRYFADISSVFTKGTEQEKAERLIAANVTAVRSGDDKVNGTDALQIQRYFADISSVFMYMR